MAVTVEKGQFVKDLRAKDSVKSVFLVKYIMAAEGKDGKDYLNIILCDHTNDLEARKWQGAREVVATVKAGDFVYVEGKVNAFQNRLQLIVEQIRKLDEEEVKSLKMDDFYAKSKNDSQVMFDELLKIVNGLNEVYIRDLLLQILNDFDISHRIKIWQAGKSIHHAYRSGLLEHILSCTKVAINLSKHYGVNHNYVVAGCIMHDICKIYELTEGPVVEYTDEGKLIGHLVQGLEMVDKFSSRIKDFPHSVRNHLKHILLSHHGEYNYGSPKLPQTSEAMLVHLIDMMDSKMASFEAIKKSDKQQGAWSGYVQHLDRIIYKNELPHFEHYTEADIPKNSLSDKLKGLKID